VHHFWQQRQGQFHFESALHLKISNDFSEFAEIAAFHFVSYRMTGWHWSCGITLLNVLQKSVSVCESFDESRPLD